MCYIIICIINCIIVRYREVNQGSFDRLIAAGRLPNFFYTADIAHPILYIIISITYRIVFMFMEYVLLSYTGSFFFGG